MTCGFCAAEFCWECLADWSKIMPPNAPADRLAHNEGCYFREPGATHPMFLNGDTLEEAVARHERGDRPRE
ncbi:hypothetical protein IMZ48_48520 [Candidatus Bathyarchaeota archaeon]|nr:hypothetical protein [Candidatus Bathyarchaeota archaeon]